MLLILGPVESCLVQELQDFLHRDHAILRSACLGESLLDRLIELLEQPNGRFLYLKINRRIFPKIDGLHHGEYLLDHVTTVLVLHQVQNLIQL